MNGDSKHHTHSDGSGQRAFTAEQKAAVIRVRKCKNTDFYDILGLEEKKAVASDGEIKKAYRKLSLLTHPDKNGYTGADEAFKMVSRAFQVLSDPDKKFKFDKFGGDPDSRFQSAPSSGASPFSGFAQQRAGRAGPMFEEEISPEELFRQFFGGGMGGGGFGGPFGGFGTSQTSAKEKSRNEVLTIQHRRSRRLRLQRGRRTWRASTSIRRQQPTTKTSQPRGRRSNVPPRSDTVTSPITHPLHPTAPELSVLRRRHNMAFSPIRQPLTTANPTPYIQSPQC